jgi:mannosyltransferase
VPAGFAAMVDAISSFAGGDNSWGRALALLYFALAGLGLFGVARGPLHVDLDLRTRPRARPFAIVVAGTLAGAIVCGYLSRSAFQPRYAMVVLVPLVLLVAMGIATLGDRRLRAIVLAVAAGFGLIGGLADVWTNRTQAGQVETTLAHLGKPGDIVAYCPDQLGPDVSRLLPGDRYQQITFPRETGPKFVDWVDYAKATRAGNPTAFASKLEQMAGPTHQIWYVWMSGYQTYGTKCEAIEVALLSDHSLGARQQFQPEPTTYYEPMELVRFVPLGH